MFRPYYWGQGRRNRGHRVQETTHRPVLLCRSKTEHHWLAGGESPSDFGPPSSRRSFAVGVGNFVHQPIYPNCCQTIEYWPDSTEVCWWWIEFAAGLDSQTESDSAVSKTSSPLNWRFNFHSLMQEVNTHRKCSRKTPKSPIYTSQVSNIISLFSLPSQPDCRF